MNAVSSNISATSLRPAHAWRNEVQPLPRPQRRLATIRNTKREPGCLRGLHPLNFVISGVILLVAVTAAVLSILLVLRRAPHCGYFNDGDRAAGVFGVLATGFAVLLGFIVF